MLKQNSSPELYCLKGIERCNRFNKVKNVSFTAEAEWPRIAWQHSRLQRKMFDPLEQIGQWQTKSLHFRDEPEEDRAQDGVGICLSLNCEGSQ
jgi:hypothetical protein